MNSQYENKVFIVYIVLWGIVALISFALNRKAKTIEKKKLIDTVGFVVVAVLMLSVVILLHLPLPGIGLLVIGFGMFFLLSQKYTFYCPHCLTKTQHLFKSLKYCPKCGEGRN
jgi:asparagine N-glycosylation enzyme membrane subunit Stt3